MTAGGRVPLILGVVNVTPDSFSDGGRYLKPEAAIAHARALVAEGADAIDVGAASSNPDSEPVLAAEEIRRLSPVVEALRSDRVPVSIDSFSTSVQAWALERNVDYLNDIQGFDDPSLYPALARASCRLILMHSIQRRGKATREERSASQVIEAIGAFFAERIARLESASIARTRMILDPGMGFFLGSNPEPSVAVLRGLRGLRERFGLPVLVSVSRKSFLGSLTGREAGDRGPATLAAELFAASQGVDYIRTHDVGALRDALRVTRALQ